MAATRNDFGFLLVSVAADCDEIASYIWNADFVVKNYGDGRDYHNYTPTSPLEYLKHWKWTFVWDKYFSHILDMLDQGKMGVMRFNGIIERLSAPAARLNFLMPQLEKECQRLGNVPESVTRNARRMHTSVNSFLNGADDGLSQWERTEKMLVENEIRQRRPAIRQISIVGEVDSEIVDVDTKRQSTGDLLTGPTIRRLLVSVQDVLASDAALLAVTGVISVIACLLQGQAFSVSFQNSGKSRGEIGDPDFYNALQSFLIQMLALYLALAPVLRSNGLHYRIWAWILAALSFGSGIAGLAVYPFFKILSPLLACVSNVLQAFVTLQLVFSLNSRDQDVQTSAMRKIA